MNLDNRIAARCAFEARILIRFCRGSQSGLGAFGAENLVIGELVTLQIPLGVSGKEVIAAKVSRRLGTQIWIPIYSTKRGTTARDSSGAERTDSDSLLAGKEVRGGL